MSENELKEEVQNKGKSNKKGNKIIIGIIVLIIIIAIAVSFYLMNIVKQENLLAQEVNKIVSTKDLTKDSIDVEDIKTTGKYAVVEKTMKTYLNDCGTEMKNVKNLVDEDKMAKILSASNIKEDGPEFENSKKYITETREKFLESSTKIINMLDKEEIIKAIEKENLSKYYEDLYKNVMMDAETEKEMAESKEQMEEATETVKKLLDVQEEAINFLSENKGNWEVQGSYIMFKTQDMSNSYNAILKKLQ